MSPLKRARRAMPEHIRNALDSRGLMAAYLARPDYQQNDYLRWITDARREATRTKRLQQMLEELAQGGLYMCMKWHPR